MKFLGEFSEGLKKGYNYVKDSGVGVAKKLAEFPGDSWMDYEAENDEADAWTAKSALGALLVPAAYMAAKDIWAHLHPPGAPPAHAPPVHAPAHAPPLRRAGWTQGEELNPAPDPRWGI